jgi:hypothetical protein
MHFKNDAELNELVRAFETCEIHPAEFKHYQHLAVALWYVKHGPYEEASEKMRKGIQRLAAAYGKTGYHETITLFWLKVVHNFFATGPGGESLFEMANKLANQHGNKNLIADYYSEERIASVQAKNEWVEPDLKQLDFDGLEDYRRGVASKV